MIPNEVRSQTLTDDVSYLMPAPDVDIRLSTIEKALSQVITYITQQDATLQELHQAVLQQVKEINHKINKVESNCKKITPQPILKNVIYSILTHCNLNCKGCSHFAPIVEKHLVSPDIIAKDLIQLASITGNDIPLLDFIGGEPLLHPNLIDILADARSIFPNTAIKIVTNGILLPSQDEQFWLACNENNIEVAVTKYPINLDFQKIEQTAKEYQVTYSYFGGTADVVKTMRKDPMDLQGKQEPRGNFLNCGLSNDCFILREGNIYPCAVIANSQYFNKRFNTDMRLSERDYIDIYTVTAYDQLSSFLSHPVPFCRYCKISQITEGHAWELSKRELSEWT